MYCTVCYAWLNVVTPNWRHTAEGLIMGVGRGSVSPLDLHTWYKM